MNIDIKFGPIIPDFIEQAFLEVISSNTIIDDAAADNDNLFDKFLELETLNLGFETLINLLKEFDSEYYRNNYPDVVTAGIDSFVHFMKVGWKESRNPNSEFFTEDYIIAYSKYIEEGQNRLCIGWKLDGMSEWPRNCPVWILMRRAIRFRKISLQPVRNTLMKDFILKKMKILGRQE